MRSEDILAKFGLTLNGNTPMPVDLPVLPHWQPSEPGSLGDDRVEFAKWLKEWGLTRGAEIGTCGGEFAVALLAAGLTVTCVDPWLIYPGYIDYKRQKTLDRAYALACERLAPYYGQCNIIKKPSLEAVDEIKDGSLDFVFIDANHLLLPLLQDIYAWTPKVKVGGIVSGHDYAPSNRHQVVEAVHAYTEANKIRPWFALGPKENDYTRSWLWVKQ